MTEAPGAAETDWAQIVALYEVLLDSATNPVVRLNYAVAVGMAQGPAAGLAVVDDLSTDARIADDYRLDSVRAHLLEMSGDLAGAREAYQAAAQRAPNLSHQRHLTGRAARIARIDRRLG